jgi:nucleotide-binding universal stress UspA family protein
MVFKSILVPIDIAQRSSWQFALPEAIEQAKAGGADIAIVTVIREFKAMFEAVYFPIQLERMIADARIKLATAVHEFPASDVKIIQEVRVGSIGPEILAASRQYKADLILMASHRPEMRDYLIGPNAAYVAQHAECSVLVLRRFAST